MQKKNTLPRESLIFGVLFLGALFLRLLNLGQTPLVSGEAVHALESWNILLGKAQGTSSRVVYLSTTSVLFSLLGSSEFWARFWPALLGSSLIWVPFLLRKELGLTAAILSAVGFILDPGMVTGSRTVGSPMITVALVFLAAGFLLRERISAGVFFSLAALFSGSPFWTGVIGLLLAVSTASALQIMNDGAGWTKSLAAWWRGVQPQKRSPSTFWLPLLFAVLLATMFFHFPSGLSAWAAGLGEFLGGWIQLPNGSALRVLVLLLVCSPLSLIFGVSGAVRAWRDNSKIDRLLSLTAGGFLIFILIYPGRQPLDLIWMLVPLWMLTGREAARWIARLDDLWVRWVLGGAVLIIMVLNWLSVTGLIYQQLESEVIWLQIGLSGASAALIILSMVFIATEWSWEVAGSGLVLGIAVGFLLYTISAMSLSAFLLLGDPRSLWIETQGAGQSDLLVETLEEISAAKTGRRDSIEGAVFGEDPVLRWSLRSYPEIVFYQDYQPDLLPPVVITSSELGADTLKDLYWGQDFVSRVRPAWQGVVPDDIIRWVAFRDGPVEREHFILWVREDVLPWNEADPGS